MGLRSFFRKVQSKFFLDRKILKEKQTADLFLFAVSVFLFLLYFLGLMAVKKIFLMGALVLVLMFLTVFYLSLPFVFLVVDEKLVACHEALEGMEIQVSFIHSVQKTKVEEFLHISREKNGFILDKTRYQSFGVGLPFLMTEGNFKREGNYFIISDMNRFFKDLSFRIGKGTEFTIFLNGSEYRLYEEYKEGTKVQLFIAPYREKWDF